MSLSLKHRAVSAAMTHESAAGWAGPTCEDRATSFGEQRAEQATHTFYQEQATSCEHGPRSELGACFDACSVDVGEQGPTTPRPSRRGPDA